jgi:hypothetical protein
MDKGLDFVVIVLIWGGLIYLLFFGLPSIGPDSLTGDFFASLKEEALRLINIKSALDN